MRLNIAITASALAALSALTLATPATATTLVTSLAAFRAGAAGVIASTPNPGAYDLTQLFLPTTTTIALRDGAALGLSAPVQVTAPQNGFPYLLSDGFAGELFIPQDASGNQISSLTISFGGISALGFEVVPFSSASAAPFIGFPGGPYTVTFALADGQSTTLTLPGGNDNTGTTQPAFVGFFGGGVSSLTLRTSDRNGFAFGNFVDVPEPTSAALLLAGVTGLLVRRRPCAG